MGARIVSITNEIDEGYPIGNKLSCLRIPTTAEMRIFLGSDMLCMKGFDGSSCFNLPFAAKPADLATFSSDPEIWQRVYEAAHEAMPPSLMPASVSGQLMPPYFNAGLMAVQIGLAFGDAWLECCKQIDADPRIMDKRPWLDQIALPVALQKLRIAYQCLDESFNYPAHIKPLNPKKRPFFCHYHFPEVIRREPLLIRLVQELAGAFPAI